VKLISHYENNKLIDNDGRVHPLRTIVISPTIDANPIFKNLKSLDETDIHDNYSDELLQEIVDDIEKNKEEKRKAREAQETQEVKPVKKLLVNVDRSEERHIGEGRIRQYHNSLSKKEKIIFNLLTYKEKLEIITSQDLDKKVKQYEDNLIITHKGDGVNRELSTFRDMEERSRYIKALGQEVMDKQYDIIKKYSDKYTKEESESDSDSVSSKSSKESIKQKKPKVAEVMHYSDNFGNNPKLLLSTKRPVNKN
jgi:hypothetical protein